MDILNNDKISDIFMVMGFKRLQGINEYRCKYNHIRLHFQNTMFPIAQQPHISSLGQILNKTLTPYLALTGELRDVFRELICIKSPWNIKSVLMNRGHQVLSYFRAGNV